MTCWLYFDDILGAAWAFVFEQAPRQINILMFGKKNNKVYVKSVSLKEISMPSAMLASREVAPGDKEYQYHQIIIKIHRKPLILTKNATHSNCEPSYEAPKLCKIIEFCFNDTLFT